MINALGLLCIGGLAFGGDGPKTVENAGYRLTLRCEAGEALAVLDDKRSGLRLADGPMVFRADAEGHENPRSLSQIAGVCIEAGADRLTIRGKLGGADVEQVFVLPKTDAVMNEYVRLTNRTAKRLALPDFECGFTRPITDSDGGVPAELRQDRWVAVPLRKRPDDPTGTFHDYSALDLATKPGAEPHPVGYLNWFYGESRHRNSEGWAWTHGDFTIGVYKFCQENMLFSVLSTAKTARGTLLRFGGVATVMGEPAVLKRLEPGETADLGLTRYETFHSGYQGALYGLRKLLDEKGCRFPAGYDPPVHWEQLYDMEGAWDHRAEQYTKAALEREAQKGVDYSCEALYLDPGWDTAFASLLWGEQWLGPRKAFIQEMKDRYGLKAALHCPLASWMSCGPMGPSSVGTYPKEASIMQPPEPVEGAKVPAFRDGSRNLALAPGAKATASSVIGGYAIHTIAHLNDGWYGNSQSWIPASLPAWAEIDLAGEYTISSVRLSNDRLGQYGDRRATKLRVLVSALGGEWREVAAYAGPGLGPELVLSFAPTVARRVRVEILEGADPNSVPRLDEIEVYEGRSVPAQELAAFERSVKRGPPAPRPGPTICQGSKQYLDIAAKRLLANCADGAAFLMFDGTQWNGGCVDPAHGHPVPYTIEDHVRAEVDLARRVHRTFPKVLIELHDPIAGAPHLTPLYYKYGLPGSWDENWGFELMWAPMADLQSARALSLYYYDLGCNVPIYLHIDLRGDNRECLELWWYASTCRHLGIGGTNPDPEVVAAEKLAMKRYRALEAFYKRGEFFGIDEQIHVHVLGGKLVVNAFNLSDKPRRIAGSIDLKDLGLDPSKRYTSADGLGQCREGRLDVSVDLPAWGAKVAAFAPSR